jgi:hypothetical protein
MRLPHFLDNQLTDGGEVVSLTCEPTFAPLEEFTILISVRGWVNPRTIVQLEGLGQLKNPMTSWDSKHMSIDRIIVWLLPPTCL